jgi:hypothetical protein
MGDTAYGSGVSLTNAQRHTSLAGLESLADLWRWRQIDGAAAGLDPLVSHGDNSIGIEVWNGIGWGWSSGAENGCVPLAAPVVDMTWGGSDMGGVWPSENTMNQAMNLQLCVRAD